MPVINELVVKSKYSSDRCILSRTFEFNKDIKVLDVIAHTEKLLSMRYSVNSSFIEISLVLGLYFIYYIDSFGKKEPFSFFTEEPISLRILREDFKPKPYSIDFVSSEFAPYIKNINAKYDIDMDCKSISVGVTAAVVVNLVEEKSIFIEESSVHEEYDEMQDFEEVPLSSVAISKDYFGGDIRSYVNTLNEISKVINQKIIELEEENDLLKKQSGKIEEKFIEKNNQNEGLSAKIKSISTENTKLMEALKELKDKYSREQEKVRFLENENARMLDEITGLNKEKNELINSKLSFRDKIKEFIARM